MKFNIKGATKYDTLENAAFLAMGLGILLTIAGFGLSVNGGVAAGSAAISGSFIFFVALVVLILTLFVREMKSDNKKTGSGQ